MVNSDLAGVCAGRCYACDRLLNERAKRRIDFERVREADREAVRELLDLIVVVPGEYDLCSTCRSYILKEVPPSAAVNEFRYPTMPAELRVLTEVEEHVLALRIPFQHIMHLGTMGSRGQYGVRGFVINVPTDAPSTVASIVPRLPDEDKLCIVNIKRKLVHRRAYARSFVDKQKLIDWGNFLQRSTLYREHGAVFDASRLEVPDESRDKGVEPQSDEEGDVFFGEPDEPETREEMLQRLGTIHHSLLMEDRSEAQPEQRKQVHTVPQEQGSAEHHARHQEQRQQQLQPQRKTQFFCLAPRRADPETDDINVAPGENKTPVSVVWDRKAEELSFPGIYLGEPRTFSRNVTRFQAMKSEVRRFDRRGACPQAVLFKYNVHVREQACGRLRHKFKRGAKQKLGSDVTREQLLDASFVASSQKKGVALPSLMPNSSEYWRMRSHDLFAMVRQLGRPHLFLTLSAAEYHWKTLIKVLRRLHQQHGEADRFNAANTEVNMSLPNTVSEEAMEAIGDLLQQDEDDPVTSEEKLRLIREDPIVCTSYFREVVLQLKKFLRLRKKGPMGQYFMTDWFIRIEFQSRGSPHCHCLLWLNNGPNLPLEEVEKATAFVDDLLTCDASHPLASRNQHKHTTTCFKNKFIQHRFTKKRLDQSEAHRYCRFGAPFWPTPHTRILLPLYSHEDERKDDNRDISSWTNYIEYLKELRLKLKDVLSSQDCPDTLDAVWEAAGCPDDHTYELAIRTGLRRPQVLYKRAVQDRWTNSYLRWVLEAFGSNTDAQIVLDIYSLVRYCVSYVTKAEKNHSHLHNEITRLRREGAIDDRTLLKTIASRSLRAKETSAQEAAWVLLNFPMCETSRKCTFVDTSLLEERHRCPKPKKAILALPSGSTDLWYPDVIDSYSSRQPELEDMTLAEYVAVSHQNQSKKNKLRRRDRIIRYRRFNENSEDYEERENFHRAMCTLHMKWRDEEAHIIKKASECGSFADLYRLNEEAILSGRRRFEATMGLEGSMEDELQACVADEEAEANEAANTARNMLAGMSKYIFDVDAAAEFMTNDEQDIDIDLAEPRQQVTPITSTQVRRRGVWDRQTFLDSIRRLNKQQKEVVLAVIDGIRLQSPPRLIYIDGAAGTGKSVVARCIANAFETFAPANNNEDSRVVISAPTGKAAYLIGGSTMHNVYSLSFNQEANATKRLQEGADSVMVPLQGLRLGNIQTAFANVYGQIIDEISMVSDRNFLAVDQRCREAKGNEAVFGNLWTIIFGDFRQLVPVGGSPVYVSSEDSLSGSALLWQQFEYVELTENMRQGEDKTFAELLTKIGDVDQPLTESERRLIESRFVQLNNLTVPDDAPRFFHKNKDKDKYNIQQLVKAPNKNIIRLTARDRVQLNPKFHGCGAGSQRKREESCETLLERAKDLPTAKAQGLPYMLLAVVGKPYRLTYNLNVADGLVNGAVGNLVWVQLGVLTATSRTGGMKDCELAVQTVWLRFPIDAGAATSTETRDLLRSAIERQKSLPSELVDALPFSVPPCPEGDQLNGLVPIQRRDVALLQLRTEPWRHVLRQQFPLTPAMADTLHASQGGSHDNVCVEYHEGMQNEMVYVGLSRPRSLEGLFINYTGQKHSRRGATGRLRGPAAAHNILFKHPLLEKKNERLIREKERLRSKRFVPRWSSLLQERSHNSFRIVYHNTQSLRAHHQELSTDNVFMKAEILLFAETWLRPGEHVELGHGMHEVARCESGNQGSRAGGVAVYSRLPLSKGAVVTSHPNIEAVRAQQGSELLVAVMYCHPSSKVEDIIESIRNLLPPVLPQRTILAGDFNVDMQSSGGQRIKNTLASVGLSVHNDLSKPTTYGGSTIDAVFSSLTEMEVSTYQSYFSHHLPLVIDLP